MRTLGDLVRINSINPVLVPGAPGEREIANYVARWLGEAGLEVAVHEPEPGRPSVTGRLLGTGGGRGLMLNAHMDTVGVEGMPEPFSAAIRDGRLYGRGAYDMKGSLATCLAAAKALARSGSRLRGDLVVAAVADEEYGSLGTADIVRSIRIDGAIVTEPTSLRVCRAHKGYVWLEVAVEGRAAHGSRFEAGIDAIGLLSGTLRGQQVTNAVIRWPLASGAGTTGIAPQQVACDVANLVLGPLHLNLLGLVVDLNQVVLNITGATGAGRIASTTRATTARTAATVRARRSMITPPGRARGPDPAGPASGAPGAR